MKQYIENCIFLGLLLGALYLGIGTMYQINTTDFKAIITGVSK